MVQEIIVILVGLVVLAILGYKTYAFFFINKGQSSCGCSSCHCNTSKDKK